ncbi:MAG: DNA-binding protein [Acidimicrobiales bacterium]
MGLKRVVRGLTATVEELERERLAGRFAHLEIDTERLDRCPLRCPVRVAGEVTGLRLVPRAGGPWLEISVSDGVGEAVAVFTGRRRIPGLGPGRAVVLEGVARRERQRLVLHNPAYTLLV